MPILILTVVFELALAAYAISVTLTTSVMFAGLRSWFRGRSELLGKLFSCPYCMCHWISFILVAVCQFRAHASPNLVLDYLVSSFAVIGLAGLCIAIWLRLKLNT